MQNWIKLFLKKGPSFNKRAPLSDKRAPGLCRMAYGGLIHPIGSCFWHFWFKSRKKNFFPKRALYNEVSDPWTLYFSKIGPGNAIYGTDEMQVVFLCKIMTQCHVQQFWGGVSFSMCVVRRKTVVQLEVWGCAVSPPQLGPGAKPWKFLAILYSE